MNFNKHINITIGALLHRIEELMDDALKRNPHYEMEHFAVYISIQKDRPTLVSMHWHEELEFIHILKGPVLIQLDEYKFEASTGDVIFIQKNCTHYVHCVGAPDKSIQGLVFNSQIFEDNMIEFPLLFAFNFFSCSRMFHFDINHSYNSAFVRYIEKIQQEYNAREPFYQMAIKGMIYNIMSLLSRYYSSIMQDYPHIQKKVAKLNRLQPVLSYIQNHYASDITLNELSKIANMSPYYFSRFFKSVMDCSPIDYIIRYRIQMSIRLLVNSDDTIAMISEQVGFSTCNYFDRAFKNQYDMSPSQYRKTSNE